MILEAKILSAIARPGDFHPSRMVFAVTGGRNYTNRNTIYRALHTTLSVARAYGLRGITVVHGACPSGLDCLASQWARDSRTQDCDQMRFPAKWKTHGAAAGPIRNRQMLVESAPRFLLAWPGGTGTANCCVNAKLLGIPVLDVEALQPW